MQIQDIMNSIEGFAPLGLASTWDNVGLMVGLKNWEIRRVLVCLDVTPKAVDLAMESGCQLILSHHPLIFKALKGITDPLLIKLIGSHIAVISLHTNLDMAIYGVNHALAERLELETISILSDEAPAVYNEANPANPSYGLGLVCKAKTSFSLQQLAQHVKTQLNCSQLKIWTAGKSPDTMLERIAICGGSGGSLLQTAQNKADVLISGDLSYHTYLDSRIPLIDAGHFYTEYPVLSFLQRKMQELELEALIMPDNQHEYAKNLLLI